MEKPSQLATKIINLVKILYTPVSLFFIIYFSWLNRLLLAKMLDVADISYIFLAVCLWSLLHLLSPFSPKIIFACLGLSITYKDLLNIHIIRLPARYLPGGIWHTVGRLADYHAFGISKMHLTILALVETIFPCAITLFIGGGYLWLTGEKNMLTTVEGALALLSLCTILLTPIVMKWRFTSYFNKKFTLLYALLVLISILFWIIVSISFLFYYSSVSINPSEMSLLNIGATYVFSWGIGYISIFAPQGIGVLEVVAGKLMALPMSLGGAVAFLAGFRIIALAADCLTWLSYRFFLFISSRLPRKSQDGITHK